MIGRLRVEAESAAQSVALVRREEAIHALLALVSRTVPPLRQRVQHRVRESEPVRSIPNALDVAEELAALVATASVDKTSRTASRAGK